MTPINKDLVIRQGETWSEVVRWAADTFTYAAISAITKAAPAAVTTSGAHGLPDQWPVAIVGCLGMTQINAENDPPLESDYRTATVTGATGFTLNAVNSTNFGTYTSGGVVMYHTPIDLAGFTARMQIRDSVDAAAFLVELLSPTGIVIDNTAKTITLTLTATATAALTWQSGVYDLELVSGAGVVTRVLYGNITVNKEVTR